MIQKADWEANRAEYLQRAQLEGFADCKATLKVLEKTLDARYKGNNSLPIGKSVKIKLQYPHYGYAKTGIAHIQ
jgi:hypothetical protein